MSDCRFGVSPVNYPDPELSRFYIANSDIFPEAFGYHRPIAYTDGLKFPFSP